MIGESITVTRLGVADGGTDAQGNPTVGASTTFSFVTLAPVVPITADELVTDAGTVVVDAFRVLAEADLVLLPTDVLTIRSVDYQMEGVVGRYNRSTTGAGRGCVFIVRRV